MKHILIALLALSPLSAQAAFPQNLHYGVVQSQNVIELQEFLGDQGYFTDAPSGNFYAKTLKAVRAFQTANGLPVTGYFGVLSRGVANAILDSEMSAPAEEVGVTEAPVTSPAITREAAPITTTMPTLEIYQAVYEPDELKDVYVRASQDIDASTITATKDGKTVTFTLKSRADQTGCIGSGNEKRCGGVSMRLAPSEEMTKGTYQLALGNQSVSLTVE